MSEDESLYGSVSLFGFSAGEGEGRKGSRVDLHVFLRTQLCVWPAGRSLPFSLLLSVHVHHLLGPSDGGPSSGLPGSVGSSDYSLIRREAR